MVCSEVKGWESRSRRETESEMGDFELHIADPKPSDLVTCRLKLR